MPEAILIAGANGAGKTTLARETFLVRSPTVHFLNADEIQREGTRFATPFASGRELLHRLDATVIDGQSFMLETTLASSRYAQRIPGWRRDGYRIILHFIELPSADSAVQRVATRVAAGGHAVPEEDIRRRYHRGIANYNRVYKPLVDRWYHWVIDDMGSLRLAERSRSNR